MTIDSAKFPQLALMESVSGESQSIGAFVEWLHEQGMAICQPEPGLRNDRYWPVMESSEKLLARYFEVDLDAVERERRQVLAEFTAAQAQAGA